MTLDKFIKVHNTKTFLKILTIVIVLTLFFFTLNLDFQDYIDGFSRLKGLIAGMMRIEAEDKKIVLFKMFETIITAFASSFIGVLLAVLCSPFLATNISNKYLARFLTVCFSIFRTVPALVMAAILVSLIGIGSFTGFISLLIITFFSATKLLKEYLEEINPAKIQSFRSFGFSKFTFLRSCIYPFSKPYIISLFFLTLESSIRGASVLGMVGAGGIGEELWKNLSFLRYDKVSFIIVILLGFIFLTDTLSWFFRKKDNLIKITTSKGYKRSKFISNFVIIGVLILLVFSLNILYEDTNKISAPVFFERLFTFLKKFRNLDFSYSGKALLALWQSFLVAFFATVFAAPSAIIVSYFANSVTSNKIIAFLIKIFINFIRTFPPVIVAILFFSGFGPGLISGFFALYLYTTGVITKVYVDVLESVEVDYGLYGKSLGLRNFYIYLKLWLPSTYTNFVSIFLYRFESNMKNSSVLGMVGAGGIGQLLMNHIAFRNWEKVWVLLIFLIITIILIENLSEYNKFFFKYISAKIDMNTKKYIFYLKL